MPTNYEELAAQIAEEEGVPPWLFVRQIAQESGFNPLAVSPAGAKGIAQLMPPHWQFVDPLDPEAALRYGARLMAGHYQKFGDWSLALAAYNAGPGVVEQYGGIPPFDETQTYVKNILGESGYEMTSSYFDEDAFFNKLEDLELAEGQVELYSQLQRNATAVVRIRAQGGPLNDEEMSVYPQLLESLNAAAYLFGKTPDALAQALLENEISPQGVAAALATAKKAAQADVDGLLDDLYVMSPSYARAARPSGATKKRLEMAGVDVSGKTANQRQVVQVLTGPDGSVATVMNDGTVVRRGLFPELAKADAGNYQVSTDRNGRLIAFDLTNPKKPPIVLDENFGFAEVDPKIKFAFEQRQHEDNIAIAKQQVAAQFAGLELQRRGQMVEAIGADYERQVDIGRMTYEEARLNLDRIDRAFTQRRQEREQVLQFAVTQSSLRAGGTETQLPLSGALAAILSQGTGQAITEEMFRLPVTNVNPEAAFQGVLGASQFSSPIAGLTQQAGAARAAIEAVLGAPQGSQAASAAMAAQAAQGV